MPITLDTDDAPNEQSALVLRLSATLAGEALTFTALAWTLRDGAGAVVNERESVALNVADPVIVLRAADTTIAGTDKKRVITLEGTYTSADGAGLEYTEEITFSIVNLKGLT